jgi:hypothetical protein
MENPIEPQDSPILPDVEETQLEEQEPSPNPEQDTPVAPEVEELRRTNAQLYARAKKAEEALKATKTAPPQSKKAESSTADGLPSREEFLADILKVSKGFTDADIADARLIATGKGLSITDAVNTEEFAALKKVRDDKKQLEQASLRASRGSQPKARVTLSTPGISDDEHKRLFLERNK